MNNHKLAIQRLFEIEERNYKQLLYKIAELSPSALLKAEKLINPDMVKSQILDRYKNGGNKVDCIKLHRNLVGSSLIESKNYVESIIDWPIQ